MPTIHATAFLEGLCRHSLTAAVVIGLALVARGIAFRGPAARWRTALWALVLVRLLMPTMPASRWSVMNASDWWSARAKVNVEKPVAPVVESGTRQIELRGFLPADGASLPLSQLVQHMEAESRWPTVLVGLWAAGAVCVVGRRVVLHMLFLRKIGNAVIVSQGELSVILDEACERIGVRRPPLLRLTDVTSTPALAGLLRPQLLLPPAVVESLSPSQLRLVMLHELAHLRRGDLWVDLFVTFVLAAHWFNPMAWVAAALYRSDREIVRDAMVLRTAGDEASQDYGRTIVLLVERLAFSGGTPIGAVGILERWGGIGQRIRAVVDRRRPGVLAVVMAVVATLVVGCAGMTDRKAASGDAVPVVAEPSAAEVKATAAAQAALDRKVPELMLNGEEFSVAIERLSQIAGEPIAVNWKRLEASGVHRNSLVSARMRDLTVRTALRVILSDASSGQSYLDFAIVHGTITVLTEGEQAVTRTYDIHDLLVDVPDFDNPPVLNQAAGARPASRPAQDPNERTLTRPERVEQIVKLVRETVDPSSWNRYGAVREHSERLVVLQTPANHGEIETLFWQLRETRAIQVQVEANFITLDASDPVLTPHVRSLLTMDWQKERSVPASKLAKAGAFLSEEEYTALCNLPPAHAISRPRVTVFNGQRGWALSSRQLTYLSDLKIAHDGSGKPRYEPVTSVVESGVLLDVQATISADRKYVTMTLRPQVSRLDAMRSERWKGAPPDEQNLFVQRPEVTNMTMAMTVSIPDGSALLFSGFTMTSEPLKVPGENTITMPATKATTTQAEPRVFMLVRPRIIEKPREPAPSRVR